MPLEGVVPANATDAYHGTAAAAGHIDGHWLPYPVRATPAIPTFRNSPFALSPTCYHVAAVFEAHFAPCTCAASA